MFGIFKKLLGFATESDLISSIQKGALIVDVRSPQEFDNGHVKTAINIPVDRVEQLIDRFKGQNVIVYCKSGGRSSAAKSKLAKLGIKGVINGGGYENMKRVYHKAFNEF